MRMKMKDEDPAWDDGLGLGADVDPALIERAGTFAATIAPQGAAAATVCL